MMNKIIYKFIFIIILLSFHSAAAVEISKKKVKSKIERQVISEIKIIGLQSIVNKDIEALLPVAQGEIYKEESRITSSKLISDYLQKRGYYNSKVMISMNSDSELIIEITENQPCNIHSIRIADPPKRGSTYQFLKFKKKIAGILNLQIGQRYDEEHVTERIRSLQEFLIEQDYILSNTDKINLNYNEDNTLVDVDFQIEYGERISFGYQGNSVFTKGELNEFITQLRSTGLGKDFISMIKNKFDEEYRKKAFNNLEIKTKVVETNNLKHVTFIFSEGKKARLDHIYWEGLTKENEIRAKEIFEKNVTRVVERGYFVETDIINGINSVVDDFKTRGYLDVKLVAKTIQPVVSKWIEYDHFNVIVQISEGEQTNVGSIDLNGFTFIDLSDVRNTLKIKEENPFNPYALEEGIEKITLNYRSSGYFDFKILTPDADVVKFINNNRIANIRLSIHEGLRYKVGEIHIRGLEKTRRHIVEREIKLIQNGWWTSEKITETETNLRKLGIFSDVQLKPVASAYGEEFKDLVVEIKEGQPGSFEAGPGYRSDLGLRAFTRLSYANFFGKNQIGTLGVEVNRRVNEHFRFLEYKIDAAYIEPKFYGSEYMFTSGFSATKQRFPPDFNAVTTNFSTGFEKKYFNNIITAKLYYKIERIRQFDVYFNNIKSDIDNQTLLIGSLNPSIGVDTRDNPFTTTRGQVSTLAFEYADPFLVYQNAENGFTAGYYKWVASSHWYFPLTKDITWANVFSGGFERSNIINRAIPLIKLFRLGGYASVRGFSEDTINADTIAIKGNLSFLNFRTQFDLPFIGDLKLSPFLDAGNVYVDSVFNEDPRLGYGVGLHYMTPIGPINFDYGIKIKRREKEDPYQIHFSIGFI